MMYLTHREKAAALKVLEKHNPTTWRDLQLKMESLFHVTISARKAKDIFDQEKGKAR